MLFRGLPKKSYLGGRGDKRLVYSSLCRRLGGGTVKGSVKVPEELFIAESTRLLSDAKMQWHHQRGGKDLQDLELTAELQHYEAATCLIDFSRDPLVALWFACGGLSSSDSSDKKQGVVVAFEAGDPSECKTIDSSDIAKPIAQLFLREDGSVLNNKPYVWNPPQGQNTRITAQQSMFVFGRTAIEIGPRHHVCYVRNKESILKKLSTCGITKKSLFGGDFDGFARILNSASSPEADYYRIAREIHANGEKNDLPVAVLYYDKALKKGEHIDIYYYRGLAKLDSDDYEGAIADYDWVINIYPQEVGAYNNRGLAKERWHDKDGVKAAYDYTSAVADYSRAIKIRPRYARARRNRGRAKEKLGDIKGAAADLQRAKELENASNPKKK